MNQFACHPGHKSVNVTTTRYQDYYEITLFFVIYFLFFWCLNISTSFITGSVCSLQDMNSTLQKLSQKYTYQHNT